MNSMDRRCHEEGHISPIRRELLRAQTARNRVHIAPIEVPIGSGGEGRDTREEFLKKINGTVSMDPDRKCAIPKRLFPGIRGLSWPTFWQFGFFTYDKVVIPFPASGLHWAVAKTTGIYPLKE
jgi:hypothetical protein